MRYVSSGRMGVILSEGFEGGISVGAELLKGSSSSLSEVSSEWKGDLGDPGLRGFALEFVMLVLGEGTGGLVVGGASGEVAAVAADTEEVVGVAGGRVIVVVVVVGESTVEVLAEVAAEESTSGASAEKRSGRIVEGVEGTECRRGGSIFDRVVVVEDELTLLARYSFSFADASGSIGVAAKVTVVFSPSKATSNSALVADSGTEGKTASSVVVAGAGEVVEVADGGAMFVVAAMGAAAGAVAEVAAEGSVTVGLTVSELVAGSVVVGSFVAGKSVTEASIAGAPLVGAFVVEESVKGKLVAREPVAVGSPVGKVGPWGD